MIRHLLSILRSPIGYFANLLATLSSCLGHREPLWLEHCLVWLCETFCATDGIQNDWHPLVPTWLCGPQVKPSATTQHVTAEEAADGYW